MVSKIITNLTQDKFVLNYTHKGIEMLRVEVEPFALNQEVYFYDEDSFESFLTQHKLLFETEKLVHSQKLKEGKAQAINERNETEEFKKQAEDNASDLQKSIEELAGDVTLTIEDMASHEVLAKAKVEGNGGNKKGKK